jgi:2-C-methyl-D-erythritol 2,4-cyclodiphosphate synthase
VGLGFDVHPLVPGRSLVLGGVRLDFHKGLAGHSDGDALLHAVMDALLGAAGMEDIGTHFPDTDPTYQDIYSLVLLRTVGSWLWERHFVVMNVDATVIAQAPHLAPYIPKMKDRIRVALGVEPGHIGIKATTTEGLGLLGQGEGIAAYAVALLEERDALLEERDESI